tara:strand:+ start:166 stop:387 length:222 start_codon:yes stop_codon:yes gene_type:complete
MSDGLSFCINSIIFIVCIICILSRDIDENGMDSYDRRTGIAGEGVTRGSLGIIYTDGKYDFWKNMIDHNPFYG